MPNGTTHGFQIPTSELTRLIGRLPPDSPVAIVTRRLEAEYAPLSAARLRGLLRDTTSDSVVITEEPPAHYMLRLIPPLILVTRPSPLFEQIDKRHPGGLYTFEKKDVIRMAAGLRPDEVVAEVMVKDAASVSESLNAHALIRALEAYILPSVGVMAQDADWYMLVFRRPPAQLQRLVAVPSDSPLRPLLQRYDEETEHRNSAR